MTPETLQALFNPDGSISFPYLWDLLNRPSCVLFAAALLEMLIPIPGSCRIRALAPLFMQLASKVNLPGNTMPQRYFAGVMLPLLLILCAELVLLLLNLVSGYDSLLALLLLPFLLESRPQSRICTAVSSHLKSGRKQDARTLLQGVMLRECGSLSSMGISKACSEYALMSTASCYLAVMVWFMLAGLKGAVAMQMIAVMARCFSSKRAENAVFGAAIHKIYQGFMLAPSLLFALSCLLSLSPLRALRRALIAASSYPSFISGIILGAAGGAEDLALGGPRRYEGRYEALPRIGGEHQPDERSPVAMLRRALLSSLIFCIAAPVLSFVGI